MLIGLIALLRRRAQLDHDGTARRGVAQRAGHVLSFTLVAISEEGLLRGYALVQLSRAIPFWPAAIVTRPLRRCIC